MKYLLLLFSVITKAQVTDITVFPMNDYLVAGNPYPSVNYSKISAIDISKFVNVMNYGAKGDGKTNDNTAIKSAFAAAQYGVIFPAGKTFLVNKLLTISLNKNMTVWAYGATIKMAANSQYSCFLFENGSSGWHNTFIWLGGTIDGNKEQQSWPGSPTGDTTWVEAAGQLLMIKRAIFVLVKDITIKNSVVNGTLFQSCKIGVVADSKGINGADIKYGDAGRQGTFFKVRQVGGTSYGTAFYCMSIDCDSGSIGVHYSTNYVEDSSISVVTNSHFHNLRQNPLHFEHCRRVFMYKCDVSGDTTYISRVQISNNTLAASVKSCQFNNTGLNFNQASDMKLGIVDNCTFNSEFKSIDCFIEGRPTIAINCTFKGRALLYQANVRYVKKCTFTDFGNIGVNGSYVVDSCTFTNGTTSVNNAKNGIVLPSCKFFNVTNSTKLTTPVNSDWKKIFLSSIVFK